jgi:hypothetical protein
MILMVMHNLDSQQSCAALHGAIASVGPSAHFLSSFWLVSTDQTPTDLIASLRSSLDSKATVYVCYLTQKHAEFLPAEAHDWLARHRHATLPQD